MNIVFIDENNMVEFFLLPYPDSSDDDAFKCVFYDIKKIKKRN